MACGAFLRLGYQHKINICIYIYGHKSTKNFMVPLVVRYGPNSYPNIYTYPLIYQPVDLSRSISTVDGDSLEHIEFPAKLLDHFLRSKKNQNESNPRKNTVDIDSRYRTTYGELRLIVNKQSRFFFSLGFESTQLAHQVQQERTQMEVQ